MSDDDSVEIDFSRITKIFKKKKPEAPKEITPQKKQINKEKEREDADVTSSENDDTIKFDFGKIKKNLGGIFQKDKEEDDFVGVDFKSVFSFFKKNSFVIPVMLIIVAMFFCVYFRAYPSYLPITDDWARSSVYNYYKGQISSQISQQYPNLPDANRQSIIDSEFQKMLSTNKAQIEEQTKQTSKQFKSGFQYTAENGKDYMYLSDIDTWLWYGETRNFIRYGHFGTEVVRGKDINFLRNGRLGLEMPGIKLHSLFGVLLYKIVHAFSDAPLLASFFWISPIVIALSVIPAFFIGRRLGGNVGGFFAAMIVAVNAALISRTSASVADTDPWNIFFPLMILWLFIEAFEGKNLIKQMILAGCSGILIGLFSYAWGGWWFVFDFILVMLVLYAVYLIIIKFQSAQNVSYSSLFILSGIFIATSAISTSMVLGFHMFISDASTGPNTIINLKAVGVSSLWPNVLTTVAEFNVVPLSGITAQMGENFMFWIGLMGLVLLLTNRRKMNELNFVYLIGSGIYYLIILAMEQQLNTPLVFMLLMGIPIFVGLGKIVYLKEHDIDVKLVILMTIWLLGTAYGFTKGVRFGILMVPAFAVSFGCALGIFYQYFSTWINAKTKININISKAAIILALLLLLINPIKAAHGTARNEVILMNDGWYDSLIDLKNIPGDGIITSWWDFGHWFVSIAEKRVTFDGADQGERIHWVGKSLLTSNEEVCIGLLRMLNCGQEMAPHVLEKYLAYDTVKAVDVLNTIIVQNKTQAALTLKKEGLANAAINDVLNVTHCDNLIPQYYIASDDMIGKAGVWAHFGGWDFRKAKMWNTVNGKSYEEGTAILKNEFNLTAQQADSTYYDIQNTGGDQWISPWPGYYSGLSSCGLDNDTYRCDNGLEFNLTSKEGYLTTQQGRFLVKTISFVNNKNEFELIKYQNTTFPYGAALIPAGASARSIILAPELAGSMFTRLFLFNGQGLTHFGLLSSKVPITGGLVQIWNVSWSKHEPINIYN